MGRSRISGSVGRHLATALLAMIFELYSKHRHEEFKRSEVHQ
jgi:hypothetical protein